MKIIATKHNLFGAALLLALVPAPAGQAATNAPAAIRWSQIGAKAGADYKGDGLAVTPGQSGARLRPQNHWVCPARRDAPRRLPRQRSRRSLSLAKWKWPGRWRGSYGPA